MSLALSASLREEKEILANDEVPAVVYGPNSKNLSLKLKLLDLERAFQAAGESTLIELSIGEEKPVNVLIKETQRHHLKNTFRHVDFYQVDMSKKITTEIPLHFVGESKAIKELGGMLVKGLDAIEVECLPQDLLNHIDVDISAIVELYQGIKVADLAILKTMKILTDLEETVANVVEPQKEEVVVAPVVEAAPAAAEKKEGEAKPEEKKPGEKK